MNDTNLMTKNTLISSNSYT